MTLKGAGVQVAVALAALATAYGVAQQPSTHDARDVKALDGSRRSLEKVRYENGTAWVELSPKQEDGEPVAWLRVSGRSAPPAKPLPDGGVGEAIPPTPERELRSGKPGVDLLDKVAPFYVSRSLGNLPPAKLTELGLDTTHKRLTITEAGVAHAFAVSTAGSAGAPYIRRDDGQVFLVGGNLISDLEGMVDGPVPGGRLVDRSLHTFKLEPDDLVQIQAGGKTRELVAVAGAGQTPQIQLAPKDAPTSPDAFAKNWHDKLLRMSPAELLGAGESPVQGTPEKVLRVSYRRGRRDLGFIEVGRAGRELYARTEHTAGWVKLMPTAADTVAEATKVASGD